MWLRIPGHDCTFCRGWRWTQHRARTFPAAFFILAVLLVLLATVGFAGDVPLQPDWTQPSRVYGPVDGVAWAAQTPVLATAAEPNMRLSVLVGSITSLSADASGVQPLARVQVEAALSSSPRGPRLTVTEDLTALEGDSLDLEEPSTYRALQSSARVNQPLFSPLLFSVYTEMGFATRLPSDPAPRVRSAKWVSAGLLFQTRSRAGRLALGIGRDQRGTPDGKWASAAHAGGHVVIAKRLGVDVALTGEAVLMLNRGVGHDSVRIGIAIGRVSI